MSNGPGNVYTFRRQFTTLSTAITLLQIKAAAAKPFEILEAWLDQETSTTSAVIGVAILAKSAGATVTAATAATDFIKSNPSDGTSSVQVGTTSTGYLASGEGTDSDVYRRHGVNILSGWSWLPIPEQRILIAGGAIVALKLYGTVPSGTYNAGLVIREIG